ncbi:hypothetical protein KO465_05230 [Candidatus Micrarchaeota archaeon]|nr:hypothetical protein [Candidatus Micrarchaeota archaeon]
MKLERYICFIIIIIFIVLICSVGYVVLHEILHYIPAEIFGFSPLLKLNFIENFPHHFFASPPAEVEIDPKFLHDNQSIPVLITALLPHIVSMIILAATLFIKNGEKYLVSLLALIAIFYDLIINLIAFVFRGKGDWTYITHFQILNLGQFIFYLSVCACILLFFLHIKKLIGSIHVFNSSIKNI